MNTVYVCAKAVEPCFQLRLTPTAEKFIGAAEGGGTKTENWHL
jgi:hypothetical protein